MLALSPAAFTGLAAIAGLAGLVRGFTGFALSAVAMALAVTLLAPVELIPILWWLEIGASLMLVGGTMADADWRMTLILVIGTAVGLYIGLSLTTQIDPDLSRIVALVVLIGLAALQFLNLRLSVLTTLPGQAMAGVLAGVVTGVAGIGGMVIALVVLSLDMPARAMRASLVAYLFLSSIASFGQHLWFGTMTQTAFLRGLALLPACLFGVWLGKRLFVPERQHLYRPICLCLLIGLGAMSLIRSLT